MNPKDRRRAPRLTLDVPITLEGSNVQLRDVSIGGIQIECDQSLEAGSTADVSLSIPFEYRRFFDGRGRISVHMRVRWCTPDPTHPGRFKAGGEVESIAEHGMHDLLSYLSLFCGPIERNISFLETQESHRNDAAQAHDERLKALGQLAGGIAHDFNNHLMIVLGRIQMMQMKGVPPELEKDLQKAERASMDAAELIKRLKDLAHNENAVPLGQVQLNAVVENALSAAKRWAQDHLELSKVDYQFETELERPLLCSGIAGDLQNALVNVLKNSMEAMPRGGGIRVATRAEAGMAVVEIEDNGPGLSPDVRDCLFEPFTSTRKGRSRGLGLCIVYGIVRRHGGRVEIKDRPEGGVHCTFRLHAMAPQEAVSPLPERDSQAIPA